MTEYVLAKSKKEMDAAKYLFREYTIAINIDLSFQHFEKELANLKMMYALPFGGIILCKKEHDFVGCIAVRKIAEKTGELKRMFVKSGYRNFGIGKVLLEKALELAKECKYERIRLDTLSNMAPVIHLYKQYGFYKIEPYYNNPLDSAIFLEKTL
jgi:ribosomal protein S18 acetylase RimI-like enzyme